MTTLPTHVEVSAGRRRAKSITRALVLEYSIWVILAVVVLVFWALTPRFLTQDNLSNILIYSTVLGIIAIGESLCLLCGKFDLSVGSTVGLTGATAAWLMAGSANASGWMLSPAVAIPMVLAVGVLIGLFNGYFIAKLGMNPLLTTLATMIVLRGLTQIVTQGQTIGDFPASYRWLSDGQLLGLPVPIVIVAALFALFAFLLHYKPIGRHIYIVGGNAGAARACGINVSRVEIFAFVMSGLLAAVAGILLAARTNSAQTTAGETYELDAISAAVIAGISLTGGRGKLLNVIAGVLVIQCIATGLDLLDVPSFWVMFATGAIIFVAILLDTLKTRLRWEG